MRGARAFIVLTGYVALMSLFAILLYTFYTISSSATVTTSGGVIGKIIFAGVVVVELFMVSFIAPAFTTGAISGERERRTFNLLRTTLLPARRIVLGKLISALAYIVLLLLVAVPLQSMAFLMGGMAIEEVLISVEILLVSAITYSAIGILTSAWTKRTLSASVLTYTFTLLTTVALPLGLLALLPFLLIGLDQLGQPVLEAILLYGYGLLVSLNPVGAAIGTEVMLLQKGTVFVSSYMLSSGASIPLISPWIVYTAIYGLVSFVLVVWSVRLVRRIEAA